MQGSEQVNAVLNLERGLEYSQKLSKLSDIHYRVIMEAILRGD